jgi:hypothetical protein
VFHANPEPGTWNLEPGPHVLNLSG